mmetsp:Transcript_9655/g.20897  ORF Transcript_9655/g.20897 Transcript_9655/m.20897 type:complete len:206 (-) Transcript_9655:526-1143(-)
MPSQVFDTNFWITKSVKTWRISHRTSLLLRPPPPIWNATKQRRKPSSRDPKSTLKRCNTSTSAATSSPTASNAAIELVPAPFPNSACKCATHCGTTRCPCSRPNAPSGAASPRSCCGSSKAPRTRTNWRKRTYTFGTGMARASSSIHGACSIVRRGISGRCMDFNGGILGQSTRICMPIIRGKAWISWRIVLRKLRIIRRIGGLS